MKKIAVIFICFVLVFGMTACSKGFVNDNREELAKRAQGQSFDVVSIWQEFCDTCPDRASFSDGEKAAADFISCKFDDYGLSYYDGNSYIQNISYGESSTQNVIGVVKADTDGVGSVVVGAHYDNVGAVNASGANDNASGVAVMLCLARYFSIQRLSFNLVFAAFGGEETGYVGSEYFVENFDFGDILLYVNVDSVANGEYLYACTHGIGTDYCEYFLDSYGESDLFLKSISVPSSDLGATFLVSSFNGYSVPYLNVDSVSFYYYDIPTVSFFAGDLEYAYSYVESRSESNRVMHTSEDNVQKLMATDSDYEYNMQSVFNCISATLGDENFLTALTNTSVSGLSNRSTENYVAIISVCLCILVLLAVIVACCKIYKRLRKRSIVKEQAVKNFSLFSQTNDEEIFTF